MYFSLMERYTSDKYWSLTKEFLKQYLIGKQHGHFQSDRYSSPIFPSLVSKRNIIITRYTISHTKTTRFSLGEIFIFF